MVSEGNDQRKRRGIIKQGFLCKGKVFPLFPNVMK